MARSGATDRDLAEIAARNRAAGARNPDSAGARARRSADELQRTPWAVEPLREGYVPPIGESATCLILAAEGKAEKMCERPVWIHGVDQRTELQTPRRARSVAQRQRASWRPRRRSRWPGWRAPHEVDVVELSAATPAEELILREALGLRRRRATAAGDQSVRRPARAATRS